MGAAYGNRGKEISRAECTGAVTVDSAGIQTHPRTADVAGAATGAATFRDPDRDAEGGSQISHRATQTHPTQIERPSNGTWTTGIASSSEYIW